MSLPPVTSTHRVGADELDRLLPQTQCRRCGFDGCRPYAEAMAAGTAPINRCPPGGHAGIVKLSNALGATVIALDPECGLEQPRGIARVLDEHCIGCTKCIQACPVDAIIGASKRMHTVIADLCTGCELCLPPCPVDCIVIEPLPHAAAWTTADADAARSRYEARRERLAREQVEQDHERLQKTQKKLQSLDQEPGDDLSARKRAIIEAAIQRARERTQTAGMSGSMARATSAPATDTP